MLSGPSTVRRSWECRRPRRSQRGPVLPPDRALSQNPWCGNGASRHEPRPPARDRLARSRPLGMIVAREANWALCSAHFFFFLGGDAGAALGREKEAGGLADPHSRFRPCPPLGGVASRGVRSTTRHTTGGLRRWGPLLGVGEAQGHCAHDGTGGPLAMISVRRGGGQKPADG